GVLLVISRDWIGWIPGGWGFWSANRCPQSNKVFCHPDLPLTKGDILQFQNATHGKRGSSIINEEKFKI
ncbi:MAG: hypothetical protein AB7I41_18230, partial [Candidatus Sericytochromatia bacterium]